jgi:hypothetical protein
MDPKLNHVEEYKGLRDEIAMYQQEMHRTWLWAIIPAGAVYTWLALHIKDLANFPRAVWFIPAGFVLLCFVRYLGFWYRIKGLAGYQCVLEKDVFEKEEACGLARWNLKRHVPPSSANFWSKLWANCRHPTAFMFYASFVWLGLLACCILLSCALSQIHPFWFLAGTFLVWLGLSAGYMWFISKVWRGQQEEAEVRRGAHVSSSTPSQSAAFSRSTSAASPPGASTPASSEPTHKA